MTDIVKRLRRPTAYGDEQRAEAAAEIERLLERLRNPSGDIFPMCSEAAAEIERLSSLCDHYAEFIAQRGLWSTYSVWCAAPEPKP